MDTRALVRPGRLGIICGLAAFLAGALGWLAGLDARAYDLALRTRPSAPRGGRVAVIEINDESIERLGRWPWRWSRHAQFVRVLQEHYQPEAIVIDLLFEEPDPRQGGAQFAEAVRNAGNVYLAAFFSGRPDESGPEAGGEIPWLAGEYVGEREWGGQSFASMHPPTPELAVAAAGVGPVNVVPELDGSVRRIPLVLDHAGRPYLSLVGVVLNGLLNPEREPVRVRLGEAVDLGGHAVPIDRSGEALVSYSPADGPRGAFPHYGYDLVLSRSIPERALAGKVVLVGFAATGMADVHPTPLASATFGLDINAHALNGLLQRGFVRVAGWPARLALALALGTLASLVTAAYPPGRALVIAVVLTAWVLGFSALVLWWKGIWLSAAAPGLAVLGAYTLTVAQRYRESERESLRMQSTVDALAQATRVIASVRLREELLDQVRAQVSDAVGARQTNLYLMDEARGALKLVTGQSEDGRMPSYQAREEATVSWVARHGIVHLVRHIPVGSSLAKELSASVPFGVGSVAYAPMLHRGEVTGVVEVVRGVGEAPFEERHLSVLEALASEAAVALENVGLYEQLEGRVELANRQLVGAYAELRQERDRVAAIVSNMADGVLVTDAEKRIAFLNPAAGAMFAVDAAEVEGQPVSEVLPYTALLEQLEDEPPEATTQIPRVRVEGSRRVVLSPRTVRLIDEEGTRTGAITVLSDITLLEELSEMKTEFVSLVSHELRTPLTSIMGFAQTLRSATERFAPGEQDQFLGIIEQESNRLLVMINDLLDISRMEAGRPLAMHYSEVDLRELAERVIQFQQVTTTAHDFRLEFPEPRVLLEADRDKVEQILTNLVSNAIKYSPRGGDIVVGASQRAEEVVVRVQDRGVGMSQEEVERLFQPYQRVDRDAIKGIRGSGLGLYLVRGLAEAHGGRVWAESEAGRGSTFYFALPRSRPEEEAGV